MGLLKQSAKRLSLITPLAPEPIIAARIFGIVFSQSQKLNLKGVSCVP